MDDTAVSTTIQPVDTSSTGMVDEVVKPSTDTDHVDTGLYVYTQALELDPDHLEQLAVRVRQKLDFILLPLVLDKKSSIEIGWLISNRCAQSA